MKTTRFATGFPCPACGYVADAAKGIGHEDAPNDGDLSICIECGRVRAFVFENDELTGYRMLSNEEIRALPAEERKMLGKARVAHAMLGWRRN